MVISDDIKENLYGMGMTKLTEIQSRAFDPIRRGKSFLGRSQTGSGKTVAYLLPLIERMRQQKMTAPHSVLILAPTRELVKQIGGVLVSLDVGVTAALVHGGSPLHAQESLVRLGPQVVISTPGRCSTMVTRDTLQLKNVRTLVVDEVDVMLGPEYYGRVSKVFAAVAKTPPQRIFFSASMSEAILSTIRQLGGDKFETVDLVQRGGSKSATTSSKVEHRLMKVRPSGNVGPIDAERTRLLVHLLDARHSISGSGRTIIFAETTLEAKAIMDHPAIGSKAKVLHSDSTEKERDAVLSSFASRAFDTLVATDVVSRGVDFADVSLVVMIRPPQDPMLYTHRAGRTGRAGNSGTVVTMYEPSERGNVKRIREVTRCPLKAEDAPGQEDVHHAAVSRILNDLHNVSPEVAEPFIADAEELLAEHGHSALSSAMAILDARHAGFKRDAKEAPSLLSGRPGFVCVLASDFEHKMKYTAGEVRRLVCSLLPGGHGNTSAAAELRVGRVAKAANGWAVDVDRRYAAALVEDLRAGRQRAAFDVTVARQIPRLVRSTTRSGKKRPMPWARGKRNRAQA